MKKLITLLFLAIPCFGNGPKYVGSKTDAQVYQEFGNIYHDVLNPAISTGTAQNLSITNLTITGTANFRRVQQVVSAVSVTPFSTTSATFQTTNLAATITPTSTSSKIIILASGGLYIGQNTASGRASLFRGSTNLGDSSEGFERVYHSTAGDMVGNGSMTFIDSPATTSATTYSVKINCGGGNTCTFGLNNAEQSIVLIEVL